MGKPLSAEKVAEIRRLAEAGLGRNEIAREAGVSVAAVTRHAPAGSFDRSSTAAAVKARQTDMAARRAVLAGKLLEDAERLRELLWKPSVVFAFGGKDNTYNEHAVDSPPFADKRTLMLSANTALMAHLRLVDHDSDGGVAHAESVLDQFMDAVAQRARELGAE